MITLKWKLHQVLGIDYYYTFHEEKFWCVKTEFVVNGVVTDSDFIFQVTVNKMETKTKTSYCNDWYTCFLNWN